MFSTTMAKILIKGKLFKLKHVLYVFLETWTHCNQIHREALVDIPKSQIKRNQFRFLYWTFSMHIKYKLNIFYLKTTFSSTPFLLYSLKEGAKNYIFFFLSLHNLISKILEQGLLIFTNFDIEL